MKIWLAWYELAGWLDVNISGLSLQLVRKHHKIYEIHFRAASPSYNLCLILDINLDPVKIRSTQLKLIGANPWRNRNERELKNSLAKRLYRNSLGYLHIIVDLFTVFCLENKNRGRDSFLMSFFSLDLISTCDD